MGATVLIVDDQASFRAVARALLESDGFEVIGEAADGAEALAAIRALQPDVALLDVRLPDQSGTQVARALREEPGSTTVVLTSTADYAYAVADCGAAAFIPKALLSGASLRAAIGTT